MGRIAGTLTLFAGLCACDIGGEDPSDRQVPPAVLRATYDDGDSGLFEVSLGDGPVPRGIAVDVWFDRFLDPDSVDSTAIRIESNTLTVQSAIAYDPLDHRVRLIPSRPLDPSLAYRLHVTSAVESLSQTPAPDTVITFSTGAETGGAPPEAPLVTWRAAEQRVKGTCESSHCHGDDVALPFCGEQDSAPFGLPVSGQAAVGLDLDDPFGILATAINVRARQWPRFSRIEPGRPDRSYVVYKMVDFEEDFIVGNLMPATSAFRRGEGHGANGNAPPGFCCSLDELPTLYPPPFERPTGRFDPDFFRRKSAQSSDPFVYDCACVDAREKFEAAPGRCNVAEGDCSNGRDDDEDGRSDCDDANCHWSPDCAAELACDDDEDDDDDGLIDCQDPDCVMADLCDEAESDCDDGLDDDSDGLVDCADPQCGAVDVCCLEDEDADGQPDCRGPVCGFVPACNDGLEAPGVESVSYCRARLVVDWIAQGAPLGPGADVCAQTCALRCDEVPYDECLSTCLDRPFDPDVASCLRDALCTGYATDLPDVDPARGRVELGGDCDTECEGDSAVACAAGCESTCDTECSELADRCPEIVSCL